MDKIILASNNSHKINEITKLLEPFRVEIKSLKELGLDDPVEDGRNFVENALIKARYAYTKTNLPALADDSGFCISSLNDFPGLCSGRFAKAVGGFEKAFEILNSCIESKNKTASFITCLAFVYKNIDGIIVEKIFEGKIDGEFTYPPRGGNGFGYCSAFTPNGCEKTFGEISDDIRTHTNHRALALNKFIEFFKTIR